MSENNFKKLIKTRIKENAFEHLLQRRGSKGQGIKYSSLEMSEYLLPHNVKMDIDEKRRIFSIKNGMVPIPHNFGKSNEKCICGMVIENMPHIYSCEKLNERKPVLPFEKVNNGSLSEQFEIFQRFEQNMSKRSELKPMMKEDRNETKGNNFPM